MGILYNDAKMFYEAYFRGVSFAHTLTIGHQTLSLHPAEWKQLRSLFRKNNSASLLNPLKTFKVQNFSDEFFSTFLGVKKLSIMDFSAYENADIIHDLNYPVPDLLKENFDVVIDGGSLEHIFNFPVAIANLMKMVKVGGSIFLVIPANNLCGHGFYQFSPELMFRIFTPLNGFVPPRIKFYKAKYPSVELSMIKKVYDVVDPEQIHDRVGITTNCPIMMSVESKKKADVPLFGKFPLQSDYVTGWNPDSRNLLQLNKYHNIFIFIKKLFPFLYSYIPISFQMRVKGYLWLKKYSFSNGSFYKKVHRH
jgi:SAM-dependent methyltransferase